MKVLVTGSTGLVGHALTALLVEQGHQVRALVRNANKALATVPKGVELLVGDITQPASLVPAMKGVELVFHAAGMPEQFVVDRAIFDQVNRQGTANVLEAALAAGVQRVVYTSTMDVFAAPQGGTLVETNLDTAMKPTAYGRSKVAAEAEVERFREQGLSVVMLNPSGVYGPSPSRVGLNRGITQLLAGRVPLLPPGGVSVVCCEGLAKVHLAAAERGQDGERYLVSDTYVTMEELARAVSDAAGGVQVPATAPGWLLRGVAEVWTLVGPWSPIPPLVTPGELMFLDWQVRVDSTRAQQELGFEPTPLAEGLARTLESFRGRT